MNNENELQIADLLQKVGPRTHPSAEISAEIKANVKLVWQNEVTQQANNRESIGNEISHNKISNRKGIISFALAASVLIAVGINLSNTPVDQIETIATVIKSVNNVEYQFNSGDWQSLGQSPIAASYKIRTGSDSYTAIRLTNGMDIRIGENTTLEITNLNEVFLNTGTLYVDSNAAEADINVRTPFGQAVDIGTQFEVKVSPQHWQVQVRDGQVEMKDDTEVFLLDSGYRLQISENDTVNRSTIDSDDDSWQWINNVSTPFKLEGATVSRYLEWFSKESGKKIEYQSESARVAANKTILGGPTVDIATMTSLSSVISTTDFTIIEGDQSNIIIDR